MKVQEQVATVRFEKFGNKRAYHKALATLPSDMLGQTSNGTLTIEGRPERVDEVLLEMLQSFEIINVERQAA